MFTTTEKCVLVLEISHKMPMEDKYTTPLTELFPKETRIFGESEFRFSRSDVSKTPY